MIKNLIPILLLILFVSCNMEDSNENVSQTLIAVKSLSVYSDSSYVSNQSGKPVWFK